MCSEVKKGKAVDAVFDGIGQAAGQPDNGQGAVLQAVNLIQPQGSNSDGMRKISAPASIRWANSLLKPI
jgi:hypothetical protein